MLPPSQNTLLPAYGGGGGYVGYGGDQPAASAFRVASPISPTDDEDLKKAGKSKDDLGPRSKVPESKKSGRSKSKVAKSSNKQSTNASEISSDTSSSKQRPKDTNANPLLTFLAGGKKR
jgi:hypothetical protein